METIIAVAVGLITGSGAAKTHPRVDGGFLINAAAGMLGGLMGGAVLSGRFSPMLSDAPLAGAAAGGAVGGIVLAVAAGIAWRTWRSRRTQP